MFVTVRCGGLTPPSRIYSGITHDYPCRSTPSAVPNVDLVSKAFDSILERFNSTRLDMMRPESGISFAVAQRLPRS